MSNIRWPENATVTLFSRWLIKDEKATDIKPKTTAMLTAVDSMKNEIVLFINPALGWRGTYQELMDEWTEVSKDTPLTF